MSDFKFFCQLVRLNIGHDFYITGNRCDFFSSFVAMFPEYSRTDSALEMLRMPTNTKALTNQELNELIVKRIFPKYNKNETNQPKTIGEYIPRKK